MRAVSSVPVEAKGRPATALLMMATPGTMVDLRPKRSEMCAEIWLPTTLMADTMAKIDPIAPAFIPSSWDACVHD